MKHLFLTAFAVVYWVIVGAAHAWVAATLMLAAIWRDYVQHMR